MLAQPKNCSIVAPSLDSWYSKTTTDFPFFRSTSSQEEVPECVGLSNTTMFLLINSLTNFSKSRSSSHHFRNQDDVPFDDLSRARHLAQPRFRITPHQYLHLTSLTTSSNNVNISTPNLWKFRSTTGFAVGVWYARGRCVMLEIYRCHGSDTNVDIWSG